VSETVGEWLRRASLALAEAGIESAILEAQLLAAAAHSVDRTQILIHPEWPVHPEAEAILARRLTREPLAYILGWREFHGHRFAVGPGVLVPRQDTETLVEAALELSLPDDASVVDVGCGSGAIAVSLSLARPLWQVTAVDISAIAAEFTRRNAEALGANVRVMEGNAFETLSNMRFDLIVSNPPYIRPADEVQPDVRLFEPEVALYGGEDGLEFYRRLAQCALDWIVPAGWVLLEVGYDQAPEVNALLDAAGWRVHTPVRDLAGVERVVMAQGP
jgi:release factor glutamine methyltransferase